SSPRSVLFSRRPPPRATLFPYTTLFRSRAARGAARRVLGSADPRNRAGAGARIPVHLFRHPGLPLLSAPRPRPPAPEQGADPYIRDGGLIPGGEIEGWTRRDRQGTHRPARGAEARRARAGVHRATDAAYARGRGRTSPRVGIPLSPGDVPPGREPDHVRSQPAVHLCRHRGPGGKGRG